MKYLVGRILTESKGVGGPMSSGQRVSCCRRVCGWGVEWSCSSVRSTLDAPNPQENKDLRKLNKMIMDWNVSL